MSLFDKPIQIGALVHYVMRAEDYLPGATRSGYEHRPAFVMDLPAKGPEDPAKPWPVNLWVLRADGDGVIESTPPAIAPAMLWRAGVVHSSEKMPGTWHWPE